MRKLDFTSAQLWAKLDAADQRRETAYKAVLIGSLCVTLASWVAILSVAPLLYQLVGLSSTQIGRVLEFCEETATTVVLDSRALLEAYSEVNITKDGSFNAFAILNATKENIVKRSEQECSCEPPVGAKGLPGRTGLKGPPGTPGSRGNPAVLPCQPPPDYKKWCPEPCPSGPQGPAGSRGSLGDKGPRGAPGRDGARGLDGQRGPAGPPGRKGLPGFDGLLGEAGVDAIPSPWIPGPPGPVGEPGPPGQSGPRGMPGIEGPSGETGKRGLGGRNGIPGQVGGTGLPGTVGDEGKEGEPGICPSHCAADGGVFFVDPPAWFFDNQRRRRASRLAQP